MTELEAGSDPTVALRDAAVTQAAVEQRQRQRRLADVASESATLVGTLRDLAEHRTSMVVGVAGGRVRGHLVAVARDHVVLAVRGSRRAHVRTAAIRSLRSDPTAAGHVPQGDRPPAQDLDLLERLTHWLAAPRDVAIVVGDLADPVVGRLVAVGDDLVTVVGPGGRPVHVPAAAIDAVLAEGR